MSRRSENQSAHDNRVRGLANQLQDNGWAVMADLPKFNQPDPIGKDGRMPYILAVQGNQTKTIEVETPSTVNAHQDQHSTFRRSAARGENWEFELIVTKPRRF